MLKIISLVLFLLTSFQIRAELCKELCLKKKEADLKLKKIELFLSKNEKLKEKYKSDVSKRIKISSNIIILSTKLETQKVIIEGIIKEQGENRCQGITCSTKEN